MMTPIQISTQRFSPNGKGGYKASEVDAFVQKVYKSYSKLYNDNNTLNERLASISPVIDEYNKNKAAIANALISAQTAADSKLEAANAAAETTLKESEEKAEALFNEKASEAEAYYVEKTHEADEKLAELQRSYTKLKAESDAYKEKYLADIKLKVDEIISGANEKASVIVAKAYEDARLARERADKIIDDANDELQKVKAESAKIKNELASLIAMAQCVTDNIGEFEPIEKKAAQEVTETVIPVEIPEFDITSALEESAEEEITEPEDDILIYDKNDFQSDEQEEDIDLFSHSSDSKERQKAEIPDVNSYLAKIFDSAESGDSDFGFGDLISESNGSDN